MSDKYTLIAAEYAANMAVPAADAPTLTKMCLWIGVSKSGYYEWKDRPLSATAVRQEYLKGKIGEIFDDNDETYGYRRVHAELARQGEQASSELVRRLMRDLGLVPCQVRKPRSLTAQATDIAKIPDRVRRDFTAAAPYRKLIGDITEIRTWQGKVYLATVTGCFSKEVIGWAMAGHFRTPLITDAMKMAAKNHPLAEIVSRILTAEATIRPTTMQNCSMSSGSASRSGEPAYAMTTRRPSRSSRPSRRNSCTAQSIRPAKRPCVILRDTSNCVTIGSVSTRRTGTGLRRRSAMSSWHCR